ncbi:MAG: hypothetical protein CVV13_04305 [Gammaproteobacteria bacterium HGW-Gammaproteobacteria-3]|nr:MAG: hypothetical protein CVV13_04305 [Gammaproteobacteria bacterium HGW-Gammaproteobacteria-3]
MSGSSCWRCLTANASPTARRILFMPLCWTRGATSARCAPCTAPWRQTACPQSAGANGCTRSTPSLNSWPPRLTRCRWLDGRPAGNRRTGQATDRRDGSQAQHSAAYADAACRSRFQHAQQALLVDLDVAKTHSRPYVSDDNPYSEAQFKTLKYRPDFPVRFGCIEAARSHCQRFFPWYNQSHCHAASVT